MKKLNYYQFAILVLGMLFSGNIFGQDWIQGKVINEAGEPLIGANVILKGIWITGTATSYDGVFELDVPDNLFLFQLEISYIGYQKKTIPIFLDDLDLYGQHTIVLKEDYHKLREVVVSAMGNNRDYKRFCFPIIKNNEWKFIPPPPEIPNIVTNVYPSPFKDHFQVVLDSPEAADYLFEVFGMDGKLIYAKREKIWKGQQEVLVNLSTYNLATSSYLLKIKQNEKTILSRVLMNKL